MVAKMGRLMGFSFNSLFGQRNRNKGLPRQPPRRQAPNRSPCLQGCLPLGLHFLSAQKHTQHSSFTVVRQQHLHWASQVVAVVENLPAIQETQEMQIWSLGWEDPLEEALGFSRQEHWSGLPFPSPMHESEK